MRTFIFSTTLLLLFSVSAFGQASWLDRPLITNWNSSNGAIPTAPRGGGSSPTSAQCRSTVRQPDTINDRALTRAGWFLYGPTYSYGTISVVTAMASVDGQCRPNEYDGFVFVGTRFAGTLAPNVSYARTDGALSEISLFNPENLTAEFVRYASADPLCCPSQRSYVSYEITGGARPIVRATTADTRANCETGAPIETQDNVVSGTVTYRQRIALPRTAVVTVRLLNVSDSNAPVETIAEERIDTAGRQVPINFDFAYDRRRIDESKKYALRAEISDGGRLLFVSDVSYPVITQGNPKNVEIMVAPVGNRGPGTGQASTRVRGTVTFPQQTQLPADAQVLIKLVNANDPEGTAVATTTVNAGLRQSPISYELLYDRRDVNLEGSYDLRAEIRSGDEVLYRSETGIPVNIRLTNLQNYAIPVEPATKEEPVVTGQSLNLSGFGTGSLQIGSRGSELLIRASVSLNTDGSANVTVSRLLGSITFTGKLIAFDSNSARIRVENSGNADASGEIEVRYNGRNLNSLSGNNLVLDGQNVNLRF